MVNLLIIWCVFCTSLAYLAIIVLVIKQMNKNTFKRAKLKNWLWLIGTILIAPIFFIFRFLQEEWF